ncbi:uncharacterized protein isoform X1 [Musca autumnalis]|uniref:uncharacterized protein isoform X1 n=1 Tax=Musca autumnalis TaxID=221902 RepID=UPI003CF918F1
MKNLTRQAVIIGSFALIFCLACIAIECGDLYVKLSWDLPENRRNHYVEKIAYALAMYVAGAIASLLLIWGARKMRPFAMIPAILCVVAAIACTIFYLGLNLVTMPFGHFQLLEHLVPLLGVEVLIFYVVVALFREIRRFKLEQQKHEGPQNPNYYDKI